MKTLEFALLGHPVAHSMSPAIHGAGYRELGLPHRYSLIDVPDVEALREAIGRVRNGSLAGANVTVPWKREALALADRSSPLAGELGAANVLALDAQGKVVAHNTDVQGLADDVREVARECREVLVLGSGGAAPAAVAAAKLLGARVVRVCARRFRADRAENTWDFAEQFRALGAEPIAYPEGNAAAAASFELACRTTDVILQATSAGMHVKSDSKTENSGISSGETLAALIPFASLPAHALAYDLVYNPRATPFLRAAAQRGLMTRHGLGMLVRQAALAMELWLEVRPSYDALYAAADAALSSREAP